MCEGQQTGHEQAWRLRLFGVCLSNCSDLAVYVCAQSTDLPTAKGAKLCSLNICSCVNKSGKLQLATETRSACKRPHCDCVCSLDMTYIGDHSPLLLTLKRTKTLRTWSGDPRTSPTHHLLLCITTSGPSSHVHLLQNRINTPNTSSNKVFHPRE